MFNAQNYVKNLPDCYNKNGALTPDGGATENAGNNFKILEIERMSNQGFKDDLQAIYDSQDIDALVSSDPNIKTKTLDLYGERVGQPRGAATDNQYLRMIKSKVFRNLSDGTYPSVIKAICMTFNCLPTDITIRQKLDENGDPVSCVVEAVKLPLQNITESALSLEQTLEIIKRLLPICVDVEATYFEGTFEFASDEDDAAASAPLSGFNTSEDTDIGGYFGLIYSDDHSPVLPI